MEKKDRQFAGVGTMSGEDEDVGRRQRKVKEVLNFDWKLLVSSASISLSL